MWGPAGALTLNVLLWSAKAGAQDFRDLHKRIEIQRQLQKIKDTIVHHFRGNLGNPSDLPSGNMFPGRDVGQGQPPIGTFYPPTLPESYFSTPPPTKPPKKKAHKNIMVVLGDPASSERDGCLNFTVSKYVSVSRNIKPVKMDLYVHIQYLKRKKSRRSSRNTDQLQKKKGKRRKNKSRKRKRKPKKRKGQRIKISVSNGNKRLAKMRMRVSKTDWYNIELPISQFPKEISRKDSFKLCIACKRCKKKTKLDLYRGKGNENTTIQNIPFIHIQTSVSNLPQNKLRSKRSSDILPSNGVELFQRKQTFSSSVFECCLEERHVENINIPYLLHPKNFTMSFCETIENLKSPAMSVSSSSTNLLSTAIDTQAHTKSKCIPRSYEPFTYSYIASDLVVRQASIASLLSTGCQCIQQ